MSQTPLDARAQGYLAWHRSVLVFIVPLFVVVSVLDIYITVHDHADVDAWFSNFFGIGVWNMLRPAKDALLNVYAGSLAVSVLQLLAGVVGACLAAMPLHHWSSLKRATTLIGVALLLSTGMVFFVQLCFPVASLVELNTIQMQLCRDFLRRAATRSNTFTMNAIDDRQTRDV